MENATTTIRAGFDTTLDPSAAFDVFVEELAAALASRGIRFDAGPGGSIHEGAVEAGRIVAWEPGFRIAIEWRAADWDPSIVTQVELRVERLGGGARVTLDHRGWGQLMGGGELAAWCAGEMMAPLLRAMAPGAAGDWITDRRARRPAGPEARATYADPLYHYPNFRVILSELAVSADDDLLEVGCGGGALLKAALESGCRAAAVDHSPDMLRVAREANQAAVAEGRLEILHASAERLPFADCRFTCAAMTGVLGFLPDPVAAFAEIRRVLQQGGRFVALGSDPELRGTPAAPEPMASRLRFYDDRELEMLARDAGFEEVRVLRRNLEPFAREAGVPEEHLPLFAGEARFVLARRLG